MFCRNRNKMTANIDFSNDKHQKVVVSKLWQNGVQNVEAISREAIHRHRT